jgi:hypothetical protein
MAMLDNFGDKIVRVTRTILISAIVIVAALIISSPNQSNSINPLSVRSANAAGICSAPGYLALTTESDQNFYIIDTKKQVICVYTINGGQLLLTAARKFDYDCKIWDDSLDLTKYNPGCRPWNKGDGIFRDPPKDQPNALCAKTYAEAFQKAWEDSKFGSGK